MSSPPPMPSKVTEPSMGLSATEVRILLLGIVYPADDGKVSKHSELNGALPWLTTTTTDIHTIQVDHEKLAAKTGYTIGSTRTVYNSARRKLMKLHGDDTGCQTEDGPPAKKPRKSSGSRKKKKQKPTEAIPQENAAEEEAGEVIPKQEEPTNGGSEHVI